MSVFHSTFYCDAKKFGKILTPTIETLNMVFKYNFCFQIQFFSFEKTIRNDQKFAPKTSGAGPLERKSIEYGNHILKFQIIVIAEKIWVPLEIEWSLSFNSAFPRSTLRYQIFWQDFIYIIHFAWLREFGNRAIFHNIFYDWKKKLANFHSYLRTECGNT